MLLGMPASANGLLLLKPFGSVGPFDRMIRSDKAVGVIRRSGAYRNVTGQITLGEFVLVDLELKLFAGLRNGRRLALPFARRRFRLAPIGAAQTWRACLRQCQPGDRKRRNCSNQQKA